MARECSRLGVGEKTTTISQENGKCEREREVAGSKKGKSKHKANSKEKRSYSGKRQTKGSKKLKETLSRLFC